MDCTGERFLPEYPGDWSIEHLHRYVLAASLCAGKRVLDVACGEGYGSALLARVAASVVGVDISAEIVEFARNKYRAPNLEYRQGSAAALPGLQDRSVDVVVSFETIEHLVEQEAMLDELARVLRPEGLLIISSPDKLEYTDIPDYHNEYHVRELYRAEFEALLAARFVHRRVYGQRMDYGSLIVHEDDGPFVSYEHKQETIVEQPHLSHAVYNIVLASNGEVPVMPHSVFKLPLRRSDMVRQADLNISVLEENLEATRHHVDKLDTVLRQTNDELQTKNNSLRVQGQELLALKAERNALRLELDRMLASRSWRLTKPLRDLACCFRNLRTHQSNVLIQKICHYARQCVVLLCLLPASFLKYPTVRQWVMALRGGKFFFKNILADAERLLADINKKGPLCRFLAGEPLRFAVEIRRRSGFYAALRWKLCEWTKHFFIQDDVFVPERLCPPGRIDLIPGLYDGDKEAVKSAYDYLERFSDRETSIESESLCVRGEDAFEGSIVAVMAHWDACGEVAPYLRHMCRHFKSLGWKVVLASAGPLVEADFDEIADGVVYRTCPGYDFTSWKAAMACFPSLLEARELVLCNDSVFGAIGSYLPMHQAMDTVACDFWGITESREFAPHLQSYHLVFRRPVLRHPAFAEFFRKVSHSDDRKIAISHETRLSLWLAVHGLRAGAFVPLAPQAPPLLNYTCEGWRLLIESGVPLIKRELLQKNDRHVDLSGWASLLQSRGYPLDLIFTYFWRCGLDLTPTLCEGRRTGKWPSDVLALQVGVDLDAVSPDAIVADGTEGSLGVFAHIFYPHLLPEVAGYLANLPRYAHLYVSTDTEEKAASVREVFAPLGFARLDVRVMPNKGWDIAPFLVGFAHELESYPLILRLHGKCSAQLPADTAANWRTMLFSSLMGDEDRVRRVLALFASSPDLGMLCPPPVSYYAANVNVAGNLPAMRRLLKTAGIPLAANTAIDFPMGSMFWCRPAALRPWLDLHLTFDDFTLSDADSRDGSLAHALERLFFFGCGISGLTWGRIPPVGYNRLSPKNASACPTSAAPTQKAQKRESRFPLLDTVRNAIMLFWHNSDFPQWGGATRRAKVPAAFPGAQAVPPAAKATPYAPLAESETPQMQVDILPATDAPELVVILPRVHPRNFSGGPNTILLFAAELAKAGYRIHCLSESPPTCDTDTLRTHLRELLALDAEVVALFRVSCMSKPLELHANDRLLASAWWTVFTAKALAERMDHRRFLYFVQDFEPLFYPWNEKHAKAILSYAEDFLPVINEACLADFFYNLQPGRFAEPAFRREALVFMPAVDRTHFHAEERTGKRTLLFYARPDAPRNLFHYGMEAIYRLTREGILTAETWEVHLMGDDSVPPTDMGNNLITHTVPWLGFADYAARIRQASVGLSLMLSPHTSYMPLELAASGVPVVTTTYVNKTAELLAGISPLIVGVNPTADAITEGLRQAVRLAVENSERKDSLNAPSRWEDAFAPLMPRILAFMREE